MLNSKSPQKPYPAFQKNFSKLKDPRRTIKGNHLYPLDEILFLCISAVISGADNWTTISLFGRSKLEWLRNYFPYENGAPSHDVLGKVFAWICPDTFSQCFSDWTNFISQQTKGEVVAVDGKTLCGSDDKENGKAAIHVVSAFACENGLCLGQQAVDQKSNEITAIPALLDLIAIKGCTVTIDAMGCQKDIASKIIEKEADYVLMVKANQKELSQQVKKLFSIEPVKDSFTEHDMGHGRIESRTCQVIDHLTFFDDKQQWKGLSSIVRVISERTKKQTGFTTTEERYYISSLPADAQKIGSCIRQHWSVENKLHWSLDVIFKEDASLKKKGHSALNFNIIAKMGLTLIDKEKSTKKSKPSKRMMAALDDNYRDKLINF